MADDLSQRLQADLPRQQTCPHCQAVTEFYDSDMEPFNKYDVNCGWLLRCSACWFPIKLKATTADKTRLTILVSREVKQLQAKRAWLKTPD